MSNEENAFADNSRVDSTIFLMEKLSFSLKLFSGHFYGQSFIKTVRGPCPSFCTRSSVFIFLKKKGKDISNKMECSV